MASVAVTFGKFLRPVKQLYLSSLRASGLILSITAVADSNPESTDFFSNC